MSALGSILEGLRWWRLRPAPELLANQPGEADPRDTIAVAATDGRDLVVAHTPGGGEIASAGSCPAGDVAGPARRRERPGAGGGRVFRAPDERDWVLVAGE